ncbi:MAG: TonB-dependent receptor [Acidobacteria bacterium]|nr:TonB-dependent receptor [Acidobacteriota bacterium]
MSKAVNILMAAFFLVGLAIMPGAVMAQTSTTGSVEGVVTDSNGAVVPSATVVLSGPGLVRPQTATADANGSYRFLQVPPGRYTVKVDATGGFDMFEQSNVEVNLSKSTSVNISLLAKGVSGTVDVVASTPEIDQSTNTTGSNISTEFFSNIPTARTVQSLYTIAPTVARSGLRDASGRDRDPSVAGSSGPENNYILDGVNTTDPAFGGGGANLPFEFIQEVEIKTGAFGADQGLSTGGVFNVITKSGGNEFHGEVFAYGNPSKFVRETKHFPFTDLAPNGFSEVDAGATIGGPIIKNRLTFFAAFNPQYRTNNYLTQTFRQEVKGKVQTPFYSGKLSWFINDKNTLTFSTFGDFTKEEGHLFSGQNTADSGFGAKLASFAGVRETGGTNYAARLNSNIRQNWIGEFAFGIHKQRNNVIPDSSVSDIALITDTFAILRANGTVAPITQTNSAAGNTPTTAVTPGTNTGFIDYVYSPGGSLQRNFVSDGFGLYQDQTRDRWEASARFQNIFSNHTFKYGFEFYRNSYNIFQTSTGPSNVYANPLNVAPNNGTDLDNRSVNGFRVTNNWTVCTTRGTQIVCPVTQAASGASIGAGILSGLGANLPAGITGITIAPITEAEALNNPFLVRTTTRVRDFTLDAQTETDVESAYFQHDWRALSNLQINLGVRFDFQQARGNGGITYLKFNNYGDNLQPRVGFSWDPFKKGKTKVFANYARFVETPIPLDVNVRAGSVDSQTDKQFNVSRVNAPSNATISTGFGTRNLGADPTPIDTGLKPQTVNEMTAGFEHELRPNLTFGVRGIYRAQGSVIEDGSFDDGDHYFLFNPGEPLHPGPGGPLGNTEFLACNDPNIGCFGRARRYYRALEFTLNKRFANNFAFNSSYVYSSLTGNYEGLFRNDNGQGDPNITSLFDLVSLLGNAYGRLPNDRPHQVKFNGSYETPWKLVVSGNFYVQSGIPFSQLVPHPVYGNNEGFGVPRGTAIIPDLGANSFGVSSAVGKSRTPTTYNLDLGVYYPIKFSESKQLRFTADWFNVTNTQRAVVLDQTFQINSGVAGIPPVSNPFYGTGLVFQYPSAFRLGAKFSF